MFPGSHVPHMKLIRRADLKDGLYFCGGVHGSQTLVFTLVHPSGCSHRPYVAGPDDALKMFHFCAHHANLYRLTEDGKAEYVHGNKGDRQGRQEFVDMTPAQVTAVQTAPRWSLN